MRSWRNAGGIAGRQPRPQGFPFSLFPFFSGKSSGDEVGWQDGIYGKNSENEPRGLFSKALFEGLMYGGKFTFQNRWASLIFGKKFTVFPCLTLYYRTISKYKPPGRGPGGRGGGGLYLEGRFNERFFALRVWGAYIWRGLFSEFYGMLRGGYFIGGTVPTEPSAGGKIFQPVENTSSAV